MTGYDALATTYRKAAADGLMPREEAERRAKVLETLATWGEADLDALADSGVFNPIIVGYARAAGRELAAEGTLSQEQAETVASRVTSLLDSLSAQEARRA